MKAQGILTEGDGSASTLDLLFKAAFTLATFFVKKEKVLYTD